jgi:type I restriction enzyme S subunit
MKKYDSYKDSGIEWIGNVPSHWDESKLKYFFSFGKGLTITKENLIDEGVPCINYGEVHSHCSFKVSVEKNSLKYVSRDYLTNSLNSLLSDGDFVFADTSEDIEGAGNFTQVYGDRNIFAGYHTIVLKPSRELNSRFFAYHFETLEFRSQIQSAVKGIKVFSVTQSILKNCEIWIPPIDEQNSIANYLDQKTNQIDNLIAKKEALIQLLEEERIAVVNNAVTRGLDTKVPMKDSCIEWLGEIPEHWEVKSFRFCIKILTDYTANGSFASLAENVTYYDRGYSRLVRLTDLRVNLENEGLYVDEQAHNFLKKSELFGGELLIANVGAYAGLVKQMPIKEGKHTLGPNMFLLRLNQNTEFFIHQLNSPFCSEQLKIMAVSSAQPKLNKDNIRQLKVVSPPLEEQNDISIFITNETNKVQLTIDSAYKAIELLKEYKTALISEVVTGKVDVRNEKLN